MVVGGSLMSSRRQPVRVAGQTSRIHPRGEWHAAANGFKLFVRGGRRSSPGWLRGV